MLARAVGVLALVLAAALPAGAQVPPVITGWGVDTLGSTWSEAAWRSDVVAIHRAWQAYLQATPGTPAADTLWSSTERGEWPAYDLTSAAAHQGFPATVLDIRPVDPARRDTFLVKTLFAAVDSVGGTRPVALTRVLAVRQGSGWRFANALPWHTRKWSRETVGPVTFVIDAEHRFQRARAERAVQFADSLATAFGVGRIGPTSYILAAGPEALLRAMGIDWTFGAQGFGYALRIDNLLLTGDTAFGEANLHELTHYVLAPLAGGRTHPLVGEGVASWLGGSMGMSFPRMIRAYGRFLRDRPNVTLDSVMSADSDLGVRPAGAMLMQMVFERAGTQGIKDMFAAGRRDDELRRTLERVLGLRWVEVQAVWRRRIEAFAGSPP